MLLMQTLQQICVVMQNETGKDTNVKLQKIMWLSYGLNLIVSGLNSV
jgi:hypothetical protein